MINVFGMLVQQKILEKGNIFKENQDFTQKSPKDK